MALVGSIAVIATGGPAAACAGLVGENGTIQLVRTATLAGYAGGVEHYVTSFEFTGQGAAVGSIVPLPGVPTKVERGGDWTLQRLELEVAPRVDTGGAKADVAASAAPARELLNTKIDALDITVLTGGGTAVGLWAKQHGFLLTPDAPAVLDFYARRSPVFMAARFDAAAARARGQNLGDGTPIHLTIPTENPWVPLRILGLGHKPGDAIDADVFLLTPRKPALLGGIGSALHLKRSTRASTTLLDDLRSDKGMNWISGSMWLSYLQVKSDAAQLTMDLATDVSGNRRPSTRAAGLTSVATPVRGDPVWLPRTLGIALALSLLVAVRRSAKQT
jgi:hypothetical protein